MAEEKKKAHAIMISMPFQGHINPFVSLALNLASKGITVTFVHLQSIHKKLSNNQNQLDLFSEAREAGLDIRYATISDGFPADYDRDLLPKEYWEGLLQRLPPLVDEMVGKLIRSDQFSHHFLVADTVYVWPAAIARKYNLVNVAFWTSPALVFSLFYHLDLLKQNGHLPFKDDDAEIDYIPGVGPIRNKDLMPSLTKSQDKTANYLFNAFEEVRKADFILLNTVQELESHTLSALNKYQPIYSVGPIHFCTSVPVSKSLHTGVDITEWLESKFVGSVLFVSFGSVVRTSKQAIQEIAHGIVLSGVNFIWVDRPYITEGDDVLPGGFEEETRDRGLVVPWCDQIRVLLNPGIGGFLTHCGWNSTLESMWCGVPMICFPISYDQPMIRKLVVDDWGVGINLCDDGMSVDREGVSEKIRRFMSGGGSEKLRREADKVKQIVRNAIENDGSSKNNFDSFILDLKEKLC